MERAVLGRDVVDVEGLAFVFERLRRGRVERGADRGQLALVLERRRDHVGERHEERGHDHHREERHPGHRREPPGLAAQPPARAAAAGSLPGAMALIARRLRRPSDRDVRNRRTVRTRTMTTSTQARAEA